MDDGRGDREMGVVHSVKAVDAQGGRIPFLGV